MTSKFKILCGAILTIATIGCNAAQAQAAPCNVTFNLDKAKWGSGNYTLTFIPWKNVGDPNGNPIKVLINNYKPSSVTVPVDDCGDKTAYIDITWSNNSSSGHERLKVASKTVQTMCFSNLSSPPSFTFEDSTVTPNCCQGIAYNGAAPACTDVQQKICALQPCSSSANKR